MAVTTLTAAGVIPRWSGALHLVGLPPLDLLADIRVLLVRTDSLPAFVLGALASLVTRALVLAAVARRFDRSGVLWALRYLAIVWPFSFLAASLLYAGVTLLYLIVFWVATVVAIVLVVATSAVPWTEADRLRDGFVGAAHSWFRLGTVGAYLVLLTALGAAVERAGAWAVFVAIPASALLTWSTIWCMRCPALAVVPRRALAAVGGIGGGVLVVVLITGPGGPPTSPGAEAMARSGSLVLMSGIDSSSGSGAILELDPTVFGWACDDTHYFSYAGPGDGQPQNDAHCPITTGAPYGVDDTVRSKEEVIPHLSEQIEGLQRPVVLAGHSQGAWLVYEAANRGVLDDVDVIVLVGAFPENPVGYRPGERAGGVGRRVLDALSRFPPPDGQTAFDPNAPLGVEWLADPDTVSELFDQPPPDHLRVLSVASTFDLPALPGGHRVPHAVDACPVAVLHPNLPYARSLWDDVVAFVDEQPLGPCPWWRTELGRLFVPYGPPPS